MNGLPTNASEIFDSLTLTLSATMLFARLAPHLVCWPPPPFVVVSNLAFTPFVISLISFTLFLFIFWQPLQKSTTFSQQQHYRMGALDLICITTNPESTTFYGFAYADIYECDLYHGCSYNVLAKSNSDPTDPKAMAWSLIATGTWAMVSSHSLAIVKSTRSITPITSY